MQRRVHGGDEGWLLSYADLITNLLLFFAMMLAASEPSRARMQQMAEAMSGVERPESLPSIRDKIQERIEAEGLQEMIRTDLTDEGLKLSLNSGLVFDSGSSVVRADQKETLKRMLETLAPFGDKYTFAIEGHTDSTPMVGERTNWELSTDRANSMRVQLQETGISRNRIRVEGYADTVPLPPEELTGLSEDEILARHRRVIVRVY